MGTLDKRPLEWRDLLSRDDFIKFCAKRGIRTDTEQLNYYENQKLLLPILYDKNPLYGTVSRKNRHLVPKAVPFYSPFQIFPLEIIQRERSFTIRDAALFAPQERWLKMRNAVQRTIPQNKLLQNNLRRYSAMRSVLADISEAQGVMLESLKQHRHKVKLEGLDEKEIRIDTRSHRLLWKRSDRPSIVRSILKKNGANLSEILDWMYEFAQQGFAHDDTRGSWQRFERHLPPGFWQGAQGSLLYALTCYRIVNDLHWLIRGIKKDTPTLTDLLGLGERSCIICHKPIFQRRAGGRKQYTCGSGVCMKEYKNRLKRRMRAEGRYKDIPKPKEPEL